MQHPDFQPIINAMVAASSEILNASFRHSDATATLKSDDTPVTKADKAVELALRELIMQHFPDHGVIGEEFAAHNADADYQWILDPIDGTRAFTCGLPTFGTLIGLMHKGVIELGVLHQPISNESWIGVKGTATTLNNNTINSSQCSEVSKARMASTSPYLFSDTEKIIFEKIRHASAIQTYGGDCYNYGLLAAGHIDIVIEAGLKPFDILPLIPILEGAGAMVTDWRGNAPDTQAKELQILVTANKALHQDALAIINEV